MTRGELWWADLGVPFGSEPGYRRPVLIIQNDFFNQSKIHTTIILPLSTNMLLAEAPGNVFISKDDSQLSKDSVIALSQMHVIDRQRLVEKISKINRSLFRDIENNLLFVLGIDLV
jgi:mRNA interferase MazF